MAMPRWSLAPWDVISKIIEELRRHSRVPCHLFCQAMLNGLSWHLGWPLVGHAYMVCFACWSSLLHPSHWPHPAALVGHAKLLWLAAPFSVGHTSSGWPHQFWLVVSVLVGCVNSGCMCHFWLPCHGCLGQFCLVPPVLVDHTSCCYPHPLTLSTPVDIIHSYPLLLAMHISSHWPHYLSLATPVLIHHTVLISHTSSLGHKSSKPRPTISSPANHTFNHNI